MTESTVTLSKNPDNTYSSIFPAGDKPSGAIGYKNLTNPNQTPTQGDIVTITTDGTYNFGTAFPILLIRMREKNMTAGQNLNIDTSTNGTVKVGSKVSTPTYKDTNYKYAVHARSTMPWGKALAIGRPLIADAANSGAVYPSITAISSQVKTKMFSHAIFEYPAANQANRSTYQIADTGVTWNCKTVWTMRTETGGQDTGINTDMYFGGYTNGTTPFNPTTGAIMISNDGNLTGHTSNVTSANSSIDPNDSTKYRTSPLIQQNYYFADDSGKVEQQLIDLNNGVLYTFAQDSVSGDYNICTNNGFDVVKTTAECRGYYVDVAANYYMADLYETLGAFRVMIGDASSSSLAKSPCTVLYVNGNVVTFEVEKGVYWQESLAGKKFYIFSDDNINIASVTIS
jgi:hypothetical protein